MGQALPLDASDYRVKDPFGGQWTLDCENAFWKLIDALTQAPVLAFTDANKPYLLHIDASMEGLGGVLYQEYPDGWRPVAYTSKS